MSLLPEDVQLPCGWVCKRISADELVLGHAQEGVEVEATRTDDSQLLPFDVMGGWKLTYRNRAGESTSERVIGRVTTKPAATEALHSCMERVSTLARTNGSTGGVSPAFIAESVELHNEIPPTPSQPSRTTN